VGFVEDKAEMGQVFSEWVSLAKHSTYYSTLIIIIIIIIRGWYNRPVVASVIVDSVPLHPPKNVFSMYSNLCY
jgi:hypothetical protein